MRTAIVACIFVLGLAAPAMAQEAYSSKDVVDFFSKEIELGASRGICVGTVEECDAQKPAAFDVLVTFDLNSADLTEDAKKNLRQVAAALDDNRLASAAFRVEGHTDALGSERYNDNLSDARAASVADFLMAEGVSQQRITAVGLGEKDPRVPDPYDPINRRVELRLSLQ
ncbi:outer membrane protein OmpA-like peptidoglycan-associated protein [Devosia sp. UYZn731]|uniref:OmpA family protein n=1 Tax=Devosia sp. UYZn731 TaxID=3156345 RepID=UPI00339B026A